MPQCAVREILEVRFGNEVVARANMNRMIRPERQGPGGAYDGIKENFPQRLQI
jgi:hypothetical protein